jgi:hypothetical protein
MDVGPLWKRCSKDSNYSPYGSPQSGIALPAATSLREKLAGFRCHGTILWTRRRRSVLIGELARPGQD